MNVGGTVETSISELLNDEEAVQNCDLYGESADLFGAYTPQGNAFTRAQDLDEDGKLKGAEKVDESSRFDEEMLASASAWRRGVEGSGMSSFRDRLYEQERGVDSSEEEGEVGEDGGQEDGTEGGVSMEGQDQGEEEEASEEKGGQVLESFFFLSFFLF